MTDFINAKISTHDLRKFKNYQKKVFFSKSDHPFLQRKVLNSINEATIRKIFHHYLKTKVIKVSRLNRSTLHILYKVYVGNIHYILRINGFSPFFKELSFYIEAFIQKILKEHNLPNFKVFVVDTSRKLFPFDFEIMEYLEGYTLFDLSKKGNLDTQTYKFGKTIAQIHNIRTSDFGPLNITLLPNKKCRGIYKKWDEFINKNLSSHLEYCILKKFINHKIKGEILNIFKTSIPKIRKFSPVLLHGDVANHNFMINKKKILGLIDWEDCLSGDPIYDIAYYATGTFDHREWFASFIKGYKKIRNLPKDFNLRFKVYCLRISISKAVARSKFTKIDKNLPQITERINYHTNLFRVDNLR